MQVVWLDGARVEVREIDRPVVNEGDALVRVRLAGICGTDLELLRGYADFRGVPGHEFVGVVEDAPGASTWEGRRVVAEINVGCGRCDWCVRGVRAHCGQRTVIGIRDRQGAFATHIAVPLQNLHATPEGLEDEQAVFAEPLAAAFEILEQVEFGDETTVAVVGDGKLGLLITMVLSQAGITPTVFGRYTGRAELAESFGAISRSAADRSQQFDVVIDATGNREGLADALARVRPRGTLVVKTTHRLVTEVDLGRIVVDEIQLIGSRCGPFHPALQALASGRLDPKVLVEAIYPLSRATDAFQHAASKGALKVLLDPSA